MRVVTILLLLLLVAGASGDELHLHEGDMVIVREDTPLKLSGKVVGQAKGGEVREISEVRGAWVNVGNKSPGWIHIRSLLHGKEAEAYLSKNPENKAANVAMLLSRARSAIGAEKFASANQLLKKALAIDPKLAEAHFLRGTAAHEEGNEVAALESFSRAIECDETKPRYWRERAAIYRNQGEYAKLHADLEALIRLDEATAQEYNELAWNYATMVDKALRNGKKGVEYATEACLRTRYKNYAYLDTLAAAYAETGDFDSAVRYQLQATVATDDYFERADCQRRLERYRLKQPWREYR